MIVVGHMTLTGLFFYCGFLSIFNWLEFCLLFKSIKFQYQIRSVSWKIEYDKQKDTNISVSKVADSTLKMG
jgi:hypothetical protein